MAGARESLDSIASNSGESKPLEESKRSPKPVQPS